MRLLMISPMFPSKKDPVYGTFIKTYMDSFTHLNEHGSTTIVCIAGRSKSVLNKAIKYLFFYLKIIFHLFFKEFDVIVVQTISTSIPPVKFVSYFKRLNLVFNVHGTDVITVDRAGEILKRISIPLLIQSPLIVVPSEYFKKVLMEMISGLNKDKIYVSPSGGVDLNLFKPVLTNSRKDLVLGFVSRIDFGKGWDTFVRLISKLNSKGIEAHGIMVGRGNEQEKLIQMIKDEGCEKLVDYIGPVSHDELSGVFNRFNLFIFPTRRKESLGLVGVEALACGVPVIGSNLAGIKDYVKDGYNGFFFNYESVDDLFDKVSIYISLSPQQREQMSKNARKSVETFDTNVVMNNLFKRLETASMDYEK